MKFMALPGARYFDTFYDRQFLINLQVSMYICAVMICKGEMSEIVSECAVNQKISGVLAIREMAVAMKIDFHEV